jgi:hypothetical protein
MEEAWVRVFGPRAARSAERHCRDGEDTEQGHGQPDFGAERQQSGDVGRTTEHGEDLVVSCKKDGNAAAPLTWKAKRLKSRPVPGSLAAAGVMR